MIGLLAGCGGPLRLAGPIEGVTSVAVGPAEVASSCAVRGEGTWISVDLALENRGTAPVEWPNPATGAAVEVVAGPEGACVIRVYRSAVAPTSTVEGAPPLAVVVPPGATSHLVGGFGVVQGEGPPEVRWSEVGPSVALAPGQRCRLECGGVYWPPRVGEPPPPDADGWFTIDPDLLSWLDPVVPFTASPAELYVGEHPRRVVIEVDPSAPLATAPD